MVPERSGYPEVFVAEASVLAVAIELCVRSSRLSGLMEILLINCTFPLDCVDVADADAGFEAAGLKVLQLENRQTTRINMGE
jgi:hypothetical protein